MEFTIQEFAAKKLIGKPLVMSFVSDKTGPLWASVAPRIKEITNRVGEEKISLQWYSDSFMLDPTLEYTKWAAVEVTTFENIPEGLQTLEIPGGTYAVFSYTGNISMAADFFAKIFGEWIPNSNYKVDNSRAHFEILPAIYHPLDANSTEQICIPVSL